MCIRQHRIVPEAQRAVEIEDHQLIPPLYTVSGQHVPCHHNPSPSSSVTWPLRHMLWTKPDDAKRGRTFVAFSKPTSMLTSASRAITTHFWEMCTGWALTVRGAYGRQTRKSRSFVSAFRRSRGLRFMQLCLQSARPLINRVEFSCHFAISPLHIHLFLLYLSDC